MRTDAEIVTAIREWQDAIRERVELNQRHNIESGHRLAAMPYDDILAAVGHLLDPPPPQPKCSCTPHRFQLAGMWVVDDRNDPTKRP